MAIDSIPLTHSARNTATVVEDIPVERITASALNPRKIFDQDRLEELAESLKQHGMIEPIVVRTVHRQRPEASGIAWFEIIAGERRWRAAKLAGLETVPTRILGQVDDETALQLALIENLQRQDLDPIEEAEGYHLLNHIVGMKQKEIAESVNRSQPAIANAMRLLELPADVQERIRAGELSRSHGVALAKYKDFPKVAQAIAERAVAQGLTSHQVEKFDLYNHPFLQEGIVRTVNDWNTPFDTSVCLKCPFGAYRAREYDGGLCLNPAHWNELAAAATKEKEEQRAALVAADDGVVDVSDLGWEEFRRLDHTTPPAGCTAECPCRKVGRNSAGSEFPACLDPKRMEGLRRAEERERKRQRGERREAHLALLEEQIDRVTEITGRELAVLVAAAFHTVSKPTSMRAAGERHGIPSDVSEKKPYGYQALDLGTYAEIDPVTLVRFAVEAVLRDDIADIYGEYSIDQPRVAFYVGDIDEPEAGDE